jgi:hypothetical protein
MIQTIHTDRVRANTATEVNRRIDQRIEENVRHYSGRSADEISQRLRELQSEWDIERVLETVAPSLSLSGLILGTTVDRRWLMLPAVVLSFLFMHAMQGWCPPVPILRRLGVRTREEIDRERYALKALRGDFAEVMAQPGAADQALAATAS